MKISIRNHFITPIGISLLLLFFIGCLERKEEIVVDSEGNTTITAEFDGKVSDFEQSASFPTEQHWTILENKFSTDKDNERKQKLKAVQKIPFGASFNETYTSGTQAEHSLRFPTQVEKWKDGNRTFYKFTRTYKARTFIHYNYGAMLDENNDLEDKILEVGIFNVSEEDRNQYVQNLQLQMLYYHYTIFDDAVGMMIADNQATVQVKFEVGTKMQVYLENTITPEKILQLLKLEDDALETEYEKLNQKIESDMTQFISKATGRNQSEKNSNFQKALAGVKKDYKITEALGSDKFSIALQLPGTIIKTNGLTDPDEPGVVYWEFSGDALHDRDLPVFALSVVEN